MTPDPTRSLAFDLLSAVLDHRRSLEDALGAATGIEERDRAAAHRLAASVLRRVGTLDAVLEPFLSKEPPAPVKHILRLGTAGLLLLETPPHAAVSTAVDLTRRRVSAAFAPLVNAVLRKVASQGPHLLSGLDAPRLDTPAWLWASWGNDARAIALAHQREAPLDVTLKAGWQPGDAALGGEVLPTGTVRFPAGTRVTDLPGFQEGSLWVQDAAASLPVRLLQVRPGEAVADLCAAPGGKTAQLIDAGATVTAVDRDAGRLQRLRENLDRLAMTAALVHADAAAWQPPDPFDAILLDAPCSATGTARRHPDVIRVRRPRDVQSVIAVQDRLLMAAEAMLRPGGRLIYAVCSLQPEEGMPRIEAAIARGMVRHEPFTREELSALPEALTADGTLRTHPGLWPERGGMDGFFAARLRRV